LKGPLHYLIGAVAFAAIFFFNISMLLILIATILLAILIRGFNPSLLHGDSSQQERDEIDEESYFINSSTASSEGPFAVKKLILLFIVFLLIWFVPFLAFYFCSGEFSFWKQLILFFTQAAIFTIGGSYTVLPYVAQFAVGKFTWLSKMQMVDGFALAETTPGPLIIVVGFVGFMAGYNHFHSSVLYGSIALIVTIFYTFLPCFLYIFGGGPLIERSHGSDAISGILKLVTAAVVGVILNLTLFLGKDVVFPGGVALSRTDLISVAWISISLLLIGKFKLNVVYLILLSLVLGILRYRLHF
jgi:chromate transporter